MKKADKRHIHTRKRRPKNGNRGRQILVVVSLLSVLYLLGKGLAVVLSQRRWPQDHQHPQNQLSTTDTSRAPVQNTNKLQGLHLIQPYYSHWDRARRAEIEYTVEQNAKIFRHYTRTSARNLSELSKLIMPGKINIIANSDIVFDGTIEHVVLLPENRAYALSRYEPDGKLFNRPDSQDVWIFHASVKTLLESLDVNLGTPGVDNRLAFELINAGYMLSNPSKSVRTWHIHATNIREYSQYDVNPPPYAIVYPVTLEEVLEDRSTKVRIYPTGFSAEIVQDMMNDIM